MAKSIGIMFAFGAKKIPMPLIEHERDSPKVNVFCTISKNHVHGPFFFEGNATADVYPQMLQNGKWMSLLQMNVKISFINRTLLHLTVRAYLNDNLPWIGRASGEDNVMLKWPLRSPDLTPSDFFSGDR